MWVYIGVAIVLVGLAVFAAWKMRGGARSDKPATPQATGSWSQLTQARQLEGCHQVMVRNKVYEVKAWERHGTTSVTPAYRFALVVDGTVSWLHVQTGPNAAMAIWLLDAISWLGEPPVCGTERIVCGLDGVFNNAIWGATSRYINNDVQPRGDFRFGRFFWDRGDSIVAVDQPKEPELRHMVSFEWYDDDMVVFYGTALAPAQIYVQ